MFSTLYAKDRKGKIREWRIFVEGDSFTVIHGTQGGKQTKRKTVCNGKNIGKANETTAEEQARLEAAALHRKQIERKGYVEDIEQWGSTFYPMKAQDGRKNYRRMEKMAGGGSVVLQNKLNGLRATFQEVDRRRLFFSRKNVEYSKVPLQCRAYYQSEALVSRIAKGMKTKEENVILDGEFYKHGMPLQDINSFVKTGNAEIYDIDFVVFDVYIKGMEHLTYRERTAFLTPNTLLQQKDTRLPSYDSLEKICNERVQQGFEGIIIRIDAPYECTRSPHLWKYKSFMDNEFKIVDVVETKPIYNTDGCVAYRQGMFVCETQNKKIFEVRPMGEDAYREQIIKYKDSYIGKWLNVKFQEFSKDGIPQGNTVGQYIRED